MIRRGEIWWADFGDPRGSKPGFRHPAIILQRDEVNRSTIQTVVVCALTSNVQLAFAPGNTLIARKFSKLPKPTVANASQIATLNKADLIERVTVLPTSVMQHVDEGIRWFLDVELREN